MEAAMSSGDLEMAGVIIYDTDTETDTMRRGRYYSEKVDHRGLQIDEWIQGLG